MKYNSYLSILLCGFIPVLHMSCNEPAKPSISLDQANIIPRPVSISPSHEAFVLPADANIGVQGDNSGELERIGGFLADKIQTATGYTMSVNASDREADILLQVTQDKKYTDEAYDLEIAPENVTVRAAKAEGIFRGIQTLLQLLPVTQNADDSNGDEIQLPTGMISDAPEYAYRGTMLDVSRHFFPVEDVKRLIDLFAEYKFNVLHLHLTDDQGWRIEIKSWPNLTKHGGSTQVDGGPGGFYTQEDYTEIVQYAQERYMTIIPEIDMPGHTNAALASYPELNCDGKAPKLYTGTKVGFSTLCTDKEVTYQFVDDVIREVSGLTPGPYFHVGGDESHETPLEDYITFINRAQEIVRKYDKTMIGWDEVSHADIDSGTVVQFWAQADNAARAVEKGAKVIMSPSSKIYLDMQYDSTTSLGQDWAGFIEVDDAYQWDPASLVPEISGKDILGIESPLWTETITNMDEIEYMFFPRVLGVAEVGWTSSDKRDWSEFKNRLARHGERLEKKEVDFYRSKKVEWNAPAPD